MQSTHPPRHTATDELPDARAHSWLRPFLLFSCEPLFVASSVARRCWHTHMQMHHAHHTPPPTHGHPMGAPDLNRPARPTKETTNQPTNPTTTTNPTGRRRQRRRPSRTNCLPALRPLPTQCLPPPAPPPFPPAPVVGGSKATTTSLSSCRTSNPSTPPLSKTNKRKEEKEEEEGWTIPRYAAWIWRSSVQTSSNSWRYNFTPPTHPTHPPNRSINQTNQNTFSPTFPPTQ